MSALDIDAALAPLEATHPTLRLAGEHLRSCTSVREIGALVESLEAVRPVSDRVCRYQLYERKIELPLASLPQTVLLVGRERRALEAVREQWSRRGVSAQLLWCSDRGFASDEGAALGMEDTPALVQALARLLPETGSSGVVFVAGDRDCELAVEAALEADVVTLMALAKALENTNRPVRRLAVACLGDSQPSAFGARGVARALAQEWRSRELSVSAVVARGSFDPDVLGRALFAQSADTDLTLFGDELGREVLVTRKLAEPSPDEPELELGPKHVILLVGGAVGIAAEMACSLAERFGCSV